MLTRTKYLMSQTICLLEQNEKKMILQSHTLSMKLIIVTMWKVDVEIPPETDQMKQ